EELAHPGDSMALEICGEPIVVVHGLDGEIRAFSNVCRHRGMLIAHGKANGKRLVCPYHNWSYDTAGRLAGAPRIPPRPRLSPPPAARPLPRTPPRPKGGPSGCSPPPPPPRRWPRAWHRSRT